MRWAVSIAALIAATALSVVAFGPAGGAVAAIVVLLWIAWRHDNSLGTCLPLLVLLLIVAGVLLLLIYLLLVTHPR